MNAIRFTVVGVAQPKGSARAFVPKGWTRAVITSDNKSLRAWEDVIRAELQRVISEADRITLATLHSGAVSLEVVFHLPKPKSTPRRVLAPAKKPDLSKLIRGAEDALSGVLFNDDAQIVEIRARKVYAVDAAKVDFVIAPVLNELPIGVVSTTTRSESLPL